MKSIGPSSVLRISLLCALLAALPIAASAAKLVLCTSCDPTITPLTLTNGALNDVQPTGADTVTDEFLNLTGTLLTNLQFSTTINTGLSTAMLEADNDFTCVAPNGFFLNCSVSYDAANGALTYDYFGVNPPDWHDIPGIVIFEDVIDSGFGNTGIPNLGLFEVQLQGWTSGLTDNTNPNNPVQLYAGNPKMSNGFNVALPEPSAVLILLTELGLLAGFLALFGRKLKWNRRFDL